MDGLDFPRVGVLPSGQLDAITDVGDIRVGHCTLDEGNVHTGVTVVPQRRSAHAKAACRQLYIQRFRQKCRPDADGGARLP